MHKEIREQNIERIRSFIERLRQQIIVDTTPFEARFRNSESPIPFDERLDGEYKHISQGQIWGNAWNSAWFQLKANVPSHWEGATVAAQIELNGEALIFDESGCPVYGLSGGSIFIPSYSKEIFVISESASGGQDIELWIEAAANNIMGVGGSPSKGDYGDGTNYKGRVNKLNLVRYDLERWQLWLDMDVLVSLMSGLPNSPRKNRIIRVLCETIDMMLGKGGSAAECREYLKQLWTPANASDLEVTGIGHAHIDTGWLWPVKETVRKCARTFASQIALIEKYPDYVFGASQPQHYQYVKEHYPALYEKIRKAVAEGRWEVQGCMWVEADCNIISGESMVRQIMHGKNFFMDEFGVDVRNLWLPDVFGYSAALPQILRKSGVDFFMTQKISWNQFNRFPFHLFEWRGVDGTSIVTHFLPEETYNSTVDAGGLIEAQRRFNENDRCDEFVSLFGIGNGGGGPKEEHVERGLRLRDLEGCPKWKPGKAGEAFERMASNADELATWSGELYLELHRGTLTSQAWVKKCNRQLESRLRAIEFMYSCLPLSGYPGEELDQIWKLVLLNQFHDIIPGSSIRKVYEQTHKEYDECIKRCDDLTCRAFELLFRKERESLTVLNTLLCEYLRPLALPEGWNDCRVIDQGGNDVVVQQEDGEAMAMIRVPALGCITLAKMDGKSSSAETHDELILENDLVRYGFDSAGRIFKGFDKEANRALFSDLANVFSIYEDTPLNYEAWDIDVFYENMEIEQAQPLKVVSNMRGPVRQRLEFELSIGQSIIRQRISLASNSKRLDFETEVDWKEERRMLRVAFPTTILANECTCDIQYSHVKRPNHRNSSWDMAKFEVAAHKYVDLSDNGYGIALLNDCKYGHKVLDSVIDLNLLRSPNYPDETADRGRHRFTYSLLPHMGTLVESNVINEACMLNLLPMVADGFTGVDFEAPCMLSGDGVSLEVLKKAEKEDCLVLRLVETTGKCSTAKLRFSDPTATLVPTNLVEWEDGCPMEVSNGVDVDLRPFEIRTYKLKASK